MNNRKVITFFNNTCSFDWTKKINENKFKMFFSWNHFFCTNVTLDFFSFYTSFKNFVFVKDNFWKIFTTLNWESLEFFSYICDQLLCVKSTIFFIKHETWLVIHLSIKHTHFCSLIQKKYFPKDDCFTSNICWFKSNFQTTVTYLTHVK